MNQEPLYYLYRHLRINPHTSLEEVFYIGKGTVCYRKNTFKSRFARAFSKGDRTQLWKNVANRGYEVEIIFTSPDLEFIENKEVEFISLYGRRILGTGTLVNVRDGGPSAKGDSRDPKKVFAYHATGDARGKFFGEFSSAYECADAIGVYWDYIYRAIRLKKSTNGFLLFYEFQGDDIGNVVVGKERMTKGVILCLDRELNLVCEYFNSWDAIKKTGFSKDQIVKSCLDGRVVNTKYIFQYKEGFNEEKRQKLKNSLLRRTTSSRPVEKLDKNMNLLNNFASESQAGKSIKAGRSGRKIVAKYCESLEFDHSNLCFWRYSKKIFPDSEKSL